MMRTAAFGSIFLALAALVACSGSKSYAKKAGKLDEAGLYAEAAEMYLQAVQRNQKNVDAKIGLKKTGQQLLNDKLGAFFRSLNTSSDKGATVDAFLDAELYADRVRRLGVVLEIPEHHRTDFERVKGEHLVELYTEGQALLEQQDFKAAETKFKRIAVLEPGYKDASSLQSIAYLEPLYRQGKIDLDAGNYRKAYDELDKVFSKDPGYKDVVQLRNEALSKGQYSIAVLPFTSTTKRDAQASRMQAYAITSLTSSKDPFLKVVDRENTDRILDEQRLGLSGVVDEQTAVRVGNLIGAQAVLMGQVIEHREEPGTLRKSIKQGFESYRVKRKDPETGEFFYETKYRPASYTEFHIENKVVSSISIKLVSLETGEVLLSRVIDEEAKDHAYYATYSGNKDALVPMQNGVAATSDRARRELHGLLNAPQQARSTAELSTDVLRKAGDRIAAYVEQEIGRILP
ncbi:MAG: hypothetical protein KDB88_10450 [Flavobacteriales bacterium]|nr:hypothetical protein [Flavobacteriales bacterium]